MIDLLWMHFSFFLLIKIIFDFFKIFFVVVKVGNKYVFEVIVTCE